MWGGCDLAQLCFRVGTSVETEIFFCERKAATSSPHSTLSVELEIADALASGEFDDVASSFGFFSQSSARGGIPSQFAGIVFARFGQHKITTGHDVFELELAFAGGVCLRISQHIIGVFFLGGDQMDLLFAFGVGDRAFQSGCAFGDGDDDASQLFAGF